MTMKKSILTILTLNICLLSFGQDFDKHLATARSSYSAGKLEDSRFAMQQMLQELDIMIGKEVLKMLPSKMGAQEVNSASDNVTGNTGFTGVLIHRDYGKEGKMVYIDIMNNSPLISSLNAILSMPFIGNASDGSQKSVKVKGYKGILNKNEDSETKKVSYDLQLPFGNTLLTLKAEDATEADVLKMAETLPLPEIAKMVQ